MENGIEAKPTMLVVVDAVEVVDRVAGGNHNPLSALVDGGIE
jgi:hypothetical protein